MTAAVLDELRAAVLDFDEIGAHRIVDRLLEEHDLDVALRDLVLPFLRDVGRRWAAGQVSIAQEHFVSGLLRTRLLMLARGWDDGEGPRALLAAAPGERHDIGLIAFGLALHRRGWRITFLGADAPAAELAAAAQRVEPRIVVVGASLPERYSEARADLAQLASAVPLAIAGEGATAEAARTIGARLLAGDPVSAADSLARLA